MKQYYCLISILYFVHNTCLAQVHVNKEWEAVGGTPLRFDWSASIANAANQLTTTGNTIVSGQGANILIARYNVNSSIAWEAIFNTSGTNNDYGVALAQDLTGNTYVVGATDNGDSTNYDVVVLKYNSMGMLQWSQTYNSAYSKNDIGSGITIDINGDVYVCASSEGDGTGYDFLVLKYNASGTLQWSNRYDYKALVTKYR
ncbi:MAG: SBBP repeat-containing protein [Edaphocola sp.]